MWKGIVVDTNAPFRGVLQKMSLVSERCLWGMPCPDTESKQRLTMTDEGRVWVSRFYFESFEHKDKRTQRKYWKIPKEEAGRLLQETAAYFSEKHDRNYIVCDVGMWGLELTNTEGKTFRYDGYLLDDFREEGMLSLLSIHLREALGMQDLFAFDDCPDRLRDIRKITVAYCRRREITHIGDISVGEEDRTFIWDYPEQLVVDLDEESVEILMDWSPMKKISQKIDFKGLFDKFPEKFYSAFDTPDLFLTVEGNPDDVIERQNRDRNYKIMVDYRHGPSRTIEGTFDRKGIPTDFAKFAEFLKQEIYIMFPYGEILDPKVYGRAKRRVGEFIVCRVAFKDSLYSYLYLTDNDDIELDDMVMVPWGSDQEEKVGQIIEIEYYTEFSCYKETGLSMDAIPKIIRLCTMEDDID